jgi:hypothetical protein
MLRLLFFVFFISLTSTENVLEDEFENVAGETVDKLDDITTQDIGIV